MRLNEILHGIDANLLQRLCAPYISVIKSTINQVPLYRGTNKKSFVIKRGFKTITPRYDRSPVNTPVGIHRRVNSEFRKRFGKEFRSGVFATSDPLVAKHHGKVYVVFPIGPLDFVWSSDVKDMYHYWKDFTKNGTLPKEEEFFEIVESYQNDDLVQAINSQNEVMLMNDCILLTMHEFESIKQELFS